MHDQVCDFLCSWFLFVILSVEGCLECSMLFCVMCYIVWCVLLYCIVLYCIVLSCIVAHCRPVWNHLHVATLLLILLLLLLLLLLLIIIIIIIIIIMEAKICRIFWAPSRSREKRLLASSCPSGRPSFSLSLSLSLSLSIWPSVRMYQHGSH